MIHSVPTYRVNADMTIGQLAEAADLHVETIRYYQRIGLFPTPERPQSGFRRYHPAHLDQLVAIKRAKSLGFSLEEIGRLQNSRDSSDPCEAASNLANETLLRVRQQIGELQQLEASLVDLLKTESNSAECAVLRVLTDCSYGLRTPRKTRRPPAGSP